MSPGFVEAEVARAVLVRAGATETQRGMALDNAELLARLTST